MGGGKGMINTSQNFTVYVHTNKINGKMYVGMTKKSVKQRWANGKGYNSYFRKAIEKYGWDKFEHEIVASNLSQNEAQNFEIILINKLQTTDNRFGYNINYGGDLGRLGVKLSAETKQKLSQSRKGKYSGEDSPTWGLKRPDLSERNKNDRKAVAQYTLDNEYIQSFPSIRHAGRYLGNEDYRRGISNCCHDKIKSSCGYKWKFIDNTINEDIKYKTEYLSPKPRIAHNKGKIYIDMDLVKTASDLYKTESKIKIFEIAKLIGRSHGVTSKYLKIGAEKGWCDYNPKYSRKRENQIRANKFSPNNGDFLFEDEV